jgi:hypothetical protein
MEAWNRGVGKGAGHIILQIAHEAEIIFGNFSD